MLSLCMCECISILIPLVLRHDIAELLLKLALNTNQSTMGATTENTNADYISKLTDRVDRRVTDEYIVLFSIVYRFGSILSSQIKTFNYIFWNPNSLRFYALLCLGVLFFFVLFVLCCRFLWIVRF